MSSSYDHDLSVDDNEFSNFDSTVEESQPSDFGVFSSGENGNGPILPEMGPEEGYALREWRRQNAIRLEEKEKKEKELLNQILVEADEYKVEFHRKRELSVESNKVTNREKEKAFIVGHEKFHAEADKDYWKSIAYLLPKEIPAIEKRKGKKDQEKKPSTVVVKGPKPGKPTDLARMRGILLKLKNDAPSHLKFSPVSEQDSKADYSKSTLKATTSDVAVSTEAVAVA